jgi:hypothetical protein
MKISADDLIREVLSDFRVAGPSASDAARLGRWIDLVSRVPDTPRRGTAPKNEFAHRTLTAVGPNRPNAQADPHRHFRVRVEASLTRARAACAAGDRPAMIREVEVFSWAVEKLRVVIAEAEVEAFRALPSPSGLAH